MRINSTIEQLTELKWFYEQILNMPLGSVMYIDGVKYTRANPYSVERLRDERGRFVRDTSIDNVMPDGSVNRDHTLDFWISYFVKRGNKRVLYELLKSQILSGYDAIGEYSWTYKNERYKKHKETIFPRVSAQIKYKSIFPSPQPHKTNMFNTGKSMQSVFSTDIYYDGEKIMFNYHKTLYANRFRIGIGRTQLGGLFPNRQEGFGLNKKTMDFFIREILVTFVAKLDGRIIDL